MKIHKSAFLILICFVQILAAAEPDFTVTIKNFDDLVSKTEKIKMSVAPTMPFTMEYMISKDLSSTHQIKGIDKKKAIYCRGTFSPVGKLKYATYVPCADTDAFIKSIDKFSKKHTVLKHGENLAILWEGKGKSDLEKKYKSWADLKEPSRKGVVNFSMNGEYFKKSYDEIISEMKKSTKKDPKNEEVFSIFQGWLEAARDGIENIQFFMDIDADNISIDGNLQPVKGSSLEKKLSSKNQKRTNFSGLKKKGDVFTSLFRIDFSKQTLDSVENLITDRFSGSKEMGALIGLMINYRDIIGEIQPCDLFSSGSYEGSHLEQISVLQCTKLDKKNFLDQTNELVEMLQNIDFDGMKLYKNCRLQKAKRKVSKIDVHLLEYELNMDHPKNSNAKMNQKMKMLDQFSKVSLEFAFIGKSILFSMNSSSRMDQLIQDVQKKPLKKEANWDGDLTIDLDLIQTYFPLIASSLPESMRAPGSPMDMISKLKFPVHMHASYSQAYEAQLKFGHKSLQSASQAVMMAMMSGMMQGMNGGRKSTHSNRGEIKAVEPRKKSSSEVLKSKKKTQVK